MVELIGNSNERNQQQCKQQFQNKRLWKNHLIEQPYGYANIFLLFSFMLIIDLSQSKSLPPKYTITSLPTILTINPINYANRKQYHTTHPTNITNFDSATNANMSGNGNNKNDDDEEVSFLLEFSIAGRELLGGLEPLVWIASSFRFSYYVLQTALGDQQGQWTLLCQNTDLCQLTVLSLNKQTLQLTIIAKLQEQINFNDKDWVQNITISMHYHKQLLLLPMRDGEKYQFSISTQNGRFNQRQLINNHMKHIHGKFYLKPPSTTTIPTSIPIHILQGYPIITPYICRPEPQLLQQCLSGLYIHIRDSMIEALEGGSYKLLSAVSLNRWERIEIQMGGCGDCVVVVHLGCGIGRCVGMVGGGAMDMHYDSVINGPINRVFQSRYTKIPTSTIPKIHIPPLHNLQILYTENPPQKQRQQNNSPQQLPELQQYQQWQGSGSDRGGMLQELYFGCVGRGSWRVRVFGYEFVVVNVKGNGGDGGGQCYVYPRYPIRTISQSITQSYQSTQTNKQRIKTLMQVHYTTFSLRMMEPHLHYPTKLTRTHPTMFHFPLPKPISTINTSNPKQLYINVYKCTTSPLKLSYFLLPDYERIKREPPQLGWFQEPMGVEQWAGLFEREYRVEDCCGSLPVYGDLDLRGKEVEFGYMSDQVVLQVEPDSYAYIDIWLSYSPVYNIINIPTHRSSPKTNATNAKQPPNKVLTIMQQKYSQQSNNQSIVDFQLKLKLQLQLQISKSSLQTNSKLSNSTNSIEGEILELVRVWIQGNSTIVPWVKQSNNLDQIQLQILCKHILFVQPHQQKQSDGSLSQLDFTVVAMWIEGGVQVTGNFVSVGIGLQIIGSCEGKYLAVYVSISDKHITNNPALFDYKLSATTHYNIIQVRGKINLLHKYRHILIIIGVVILFLLAGTYRLSLSLSKQKSYVRIKQNKIEDKKGNINDTRNQLPKNQKNEIKDQ